MVRSSSLRSKLFQAMGGSGGTQPSQLNCRAWPRRGWYSLDGRYESISQELHRHTIVIFSNQAIKSEALKHWKEKVSSMGSKVCLFMSCRHVWGLNFDVAQGCTFLVICSYRKGCVSKTDVRNVVGTGKNFQRAGYQNRWGSNLRLSKALLMPDIQTWMLRSS